MESILVGIRATKIEGKIMADLDSYLLKCTLESIERGVPVNKIQTECKYQQGLIDLVPDNNNTINK